MYKVEIKRQAKRKLESLSNRDRLRIVDKIDQLAVNPDDPTLDIKRMAASDFYRLRVGGWRIIYGRSNLLRVISIEKIGTRGDVYK